MRKELKLSEIKKIIFDNEHEDGKFMCISIVKKDDTMEVIIEKGDPAELAAIFDRLPFKKGKRKVN